MSTKTEAIVLSKIKYSDSSYIVNLFTKDFGRVAVFVRISGTKAKSKEKIKTALLFPLNIIEVELSLRETRNIQTLKYCNFVEQINMVCLDVHKAAIAQFIAEIILKTMKDEQSDIGLYQYLKSIIMHLNNQSELTNNLHLLFLKEYAKFLGFQITNNYSVLTPYFNLREGMFLNVFTTEEETLDMELSSALSNLININLESLSRFKLNYTTRKKLLDAFLLYFKMHIEKLPEIKSLKVLNEVFAG